MRSMLTFVLPVAVISCLLMTSSFVGQVTSSPLSKTAEHGSSSSSILRFIPEARAFASHVIVRQDRPTVSHGGHNSFVDVVDCELCKVAVSLIQEMLTKNASHKDILHAFVSVCSLLRIETKRVCGGLASLFSTEFFTVLDKLVVSPHELCSLLLDSCGKPYDPYTGWNVTLPDVPQPTPKPPVLPKKGSPSLRFLHLTDVHIDLMYKAGSVADCGEPLCCRGGNGGADGAWHFGDYRDCDTPPWTLENLLSHLANQSDSFDYIIWTGDIPGHNVWNQTRADQLHVIAYATNLIAKHFPNKPIYPSLGNHEGSPVNSFPPSYITGNNSISWLYDALAVHWSQFLPKDAIATVKEGAFYTVSPYPGFRIISLNMNYCNNENWWMLLNTTDPNGELSWLIKVLQAAENHKEKVHIIGHIPPGVHDCLRGWSWNFYKIVSRYQNTIVGQFYGHTHSDSFEVFYDVETLQKPVGVAYVGPSVTPYSDQNMGYRFYTIDGHYSGSSYEVLDHETYFLNLTRAHLEKKITWEFEYSAKAAYNMTSLFPADWNHLINVMKTNQTLMDSYNRYYLKSRSTGHCDASCRYKLLCETRSGRSGDPSLCKDIPSY